jgi:hypothetical protein
VIVKRVTRVHLSYHPEAGDNPWLVEWTTANHLGKAEHLKATSCTEASARRLAGNLVDMHVDGLTEKDVYRESI